MSFACQYNKFSVRRQSVFLSRYVIDVICINYDVGFHEPSPIDKPKQTNMFKGVDMKKFSVISRALRYWPLLQ